MIRKTENLMTKLNAKAKISYQYPNDVFGAAV